MAPVYIIKSTWIQLGTDPVVHHSAQGTQGFPTKEYAQKTCDNMDKKFPDEKHEIIVGPPGTKLLDYDWDNF
jgi:hypothetical protein